MSHALPVSRFHADPSQCTRCGLCVADCPANIIRLESGGVPRITPEDDADCIYCQHCLAICPVAAISVAGKIPGDSRPLEKTGAADAAAIERAIYARRSVRKFAAEPVDAATIRRILNVVAHAPTAVNARDLHSTVVSGADAMAALRKRTCEALASLGERLPEDVRWMGSVARQWLDGGADGIFRDAPHLIVMTGGPNQVHTKVDSVIALSYFDLYASAQGIGTTWCGMFDTVLRIVPESKTWLGIPEEREIGYAMLFGKAAVRYARTAQHGPADVDIVERLL